MPQAQLPVYIGAETQHLAIVQDDERVLTGVCSQDSPAAELCAMSHQPDGLQNVHPAWWYVVNALASQLPHVVSPASAELSFCHYKERVGGAGCDANNLVAS